MRTIIAVLTVWAVTMSSMAASDGEWQESILKAATLEKIYAASGVYQRCMGEELQAYLSSATDSRAITDAILKKCEPQLQPMRDALTAEKVPAELADRYLHKTRIHAARNLIRKVMAMQAMRGG